MSAERIPLIEIASASPQPYRLNKHRRLRCENVELSLPVGDGEHRIVVSLAYDSDNHLRELCFVGRGKTCNGANDKIGHNIDSLLHELGIRLSRAIQGRNPSGEAPIALAEAAD